MQKQLSELSGCRVTLYQAPDPGILFLQPVDAHDEGLLDRQIENMSNITRSFALAAFEVKNWSRDLSPWEAPPVFGRENFGGAAEETLRFAADRLLPELRRLLPLDENTKVCIGGYSLAGLFALWAATRTDLFSGVAAASPSVWFPGWLDYVRETPVQADPVYLSLGDREDRAKNPVMASVGSCIRTLYGLLCPDHTVTLEWNPGNHFQDSELRMAKAFLWLAGQVKE